MTKFAYALMAAAGAALLSTASHAAIVTQWTFNSAVPDAAVSTGTTSPATGAGTAALVGGTTATFATGTATDTSSVGDNSGWNTATYPAATVGNKTAGVEFAVPTTGYEDITLSFEHRHSNTAAANFRIQYSLDGTNFIDDVAYSALGTQDTFLARSADFSSIAAADNNPNFKVRVVAEFADGGAYVATRTSVATTYGASGTNRFDLVTINGTPIPEPASLALIGLGGLGLLARRRTR